MWSTGLDLLLNVCSGQSMARRKGRSPKNKEEKRSAYEHRKHVHKCKLLEYLSNVENEWPKRQDYHTVILGYGCKNGVLYQYFTSKELTEIERQALDERRSRYALFLSAIDKALINRALEGSEQAIKLCYQRFEGWTEKQQVEHKGNIQHLHAVDAQTKELLANLKQRIQQSSNNASVEQTNSVAIEQGDTASDVEVIDVQPVEYSDSTIAQRDNLGEQDENANDFR